MASGTSLSGYVLSLTGVNFPDSMSSLRTINCSWSLQPHSCVTTCQALLGKCVLRSSRGVVALKAGLIASNIEAAEQIRTN